MVLHISVIVSQIRESDFRVILIEDSSNEPTVHLQDIELSKPVIIEKESDNYTAEQIDMIESLDVGNKIHATIQSSDYIDGEFVLNDGYWYFKDINILTKTRITFIDNPEEPPLRFKKLCSTVDESKERGMKIKIDSNNEKIGRLDIFSTYHEPNAWEELCTGFRLFEVAIEDNFGQEYTQPKPPYEIIFISLNNRNHILGFHFNNYGTKLARKLKNLNCENKYN